MTAPDSPYVHLSIGSWFTDALDVGARDSDGVLWTCTKLDGWWDGANRRIDNLPKASAHGAYPGRSLADARVIVAEGWWYAPTFAAKAAAERRMSALLADGSRQTFSVAEPIGTLTSTVQLSGATDVEPVTIFDGRWSLQLTASDPRRYSTVPSSVTFGLAAGSTSGLDFTAPGLDFSGAGLDFGPPGSIGQGTLTNTGTAPTEPVFTIAGPLPPFMLRAAATGASIGYPAGLSAGETLVVDVGRRTARLSGTADRRPAPAQWSGFTVPPGGSLTVSLVGTAGGSGTGLVTATCSPAYW